MDTRHGITISTRDRLLRAWECSTELVRDFESFSKELSDNDAEVSALFAEYAEQEGHHAARFLELLREFE